MELRGQNKETGIPSSLVYSPPTRDTSSKVSSAPVITALIERRRDHQNQTLYHHHHHHHHQQQQLNLQHQQIRDPDLTLDPASAPLPASIVVTSSENTTPAPSRSFSRSPPPAPTSSAITTTASTLPPVRYRECLKNHAANMGGHVVDGCGEFMPAGEEGTLEALKCAACECHRNFHRRETDGEPPNSTHYKNNYSHRITLPPPPSLAQSQLPSLHQRHGYPHGHGSGYTVPVAPVMMSFGGAGGGGGGGLAAESSSEDLHMFQSSMHGQATVQPSLSKKRFRTKFSQEQKDKMMELAEKLEWKIQKQNEQEVQQFCSQLGIKRKVFKVWMHNNKQAMKKKQM